MFVDSHCHLHLLDLSDDNGELEPVLMRARQKKVSHMLCVSTALDDFSRLVRLADTYDDVSISVGVHPNHDSQIDYTLDDILNKNHEKCVAIGETGLDYFRSEGDLSWQRERFVLHIEAAKQRKSPLIIHTRDAKKDTLEIMRTEQANQVQGVMHCFTEDWDMAKAAMDMGFYISFSGIVTFKSATQLQEVARKMPIDRMLIETDCPYLAPVPHRGKQNEPSYVPMVAAFLAHLRNESVESIANNTTQNYHRLFGPKA